MLACRCIMGDVQLKNWFQIYFIHTRIFKINFREYGKSLADINGDIVNMRRETTDNVQVVLENENIDGEAVIA